MILNFVERRSDDAIFEDVNGLLYIAKVVAVDGETLKSLGYPGFSASCLTPNSDKWVIGVGTSVATSRKSATLSGDPDQRTAINLMFERLSDGKTVIYEGESQELPLMES